MSARGAALLVFVAIAAPACGGERPSGSSAKQPISIDLDKISPRGGERSSDDPASPVRRSRQSTKLSAPILLLEGEIHPVSMALDTTHIYWTGVFDTSIPPDYGSVMKVPKAGGDPVILTYSEVRPAGIAVDGENVYWTNLDKRSVRKVAKSGGEPATLWSGAGLQAGIAIDDTSVYVIRESPNEILRIPKTGGAPEKIADGPQEPGDIAALDGEVVWIGLPGVGHFRGGTASILLANEPCTWGDRGLRRLAMDDRRVYTIRCVPYPGIDEGPFRYLGLSGPILAIARDGSGHRSLAAGDFTGPLAADEAHVYFTNSIDGLLRVAKTGGEPKKVETGGDLPLTDIAADESGVYFLAGSSPSKLDGVVVKLARIP